MKDEKPITWVMRGFLLGAGGALFAVFLGLFDRPEREEERETELEIYEE